MFKLSVLLICLNSVFCFSPLLVKGTCYQSPIELCKSASKIGIVANSTNINFLLKVLRAKNVESAYVYGWEDHTRIMILYRNGALVPYIPNRICSEYAFCYGACPCVPVVLTGKSCCIQEKLPVRKCEIPSVNTCVEDNGSCKIETQHDKLEEFGQKIEVLNPCCGQAYVPVPRKEDLCCAPVQENNKICHEESDLEYTWDEISEECCIQEECSTVERNCSTHHYEQRPEGRNKFIRKECIRPTKKVSFRPVPKVSKKRLLHSKTFEYDCLDNELVLKIKEEIVSVNKINKHLSKSGLKIPPILYKPAFLFKLKYKIQKKYKHEICLYVTDKNLLIVEIKGRLYYLNCSSKGKSKTQYHLKKIDDRERKEIVRNGIHMIVLNYEAITQ
ncbi:hypothetical protein P3W45_000163 [Vairimorpha bombi]|jgi:hypothetical protein